MAFNASLTLPAVNTSLTLPAINTCRQDSTCHRILLAIFLDGAMLPDGWGYFGCVGERIWCNQWCVISWSGARLSIALASLSFVAGNWLIVSSHDVEGPWKFRATALSRFPVHRNLMKLCIDKLHVLLQGAALCFWIQGFRHCWFVSSILLRVQISIFLWDCHAPTVQIIWVVWSCVRSIFLSDSIVKDKRSDTKSKYTLENSDCVRGFEVSVLIIDYYLKIFQTCIDDGSIVCMSNLNSPSLCDIIFMILDTCLLFWKEDNSNFWLIENSKLQQQAGSKKSG